VQTFVMHGTMYRGGPRPTWYVVDQATADELAPLVQKHNDPDSKPLFQIFTKEQKEAVARDEQDLYLASIGATARTVVNPKTTAPPPTVDVRSLPGGARGRMSALPEPRLPAVPETEVASVQPGDAVVSSREINADRG